MASIGTRKQSLIPFLLLVLLVLFGGALAVGFFLFFEGAPPKLAITSPTAYLSRSGTIVVSAQDDESGLRHVQLHITQGDRQQELYGEDFARKGYTGMVGTPKKTVEITFDPTNSAFADGPATISVTAADYSFRGFFAGNRVTTSQEVIIDTTAPQISILYSDRYVSPGGSGLVIYRVNDRTATSGVEINDTFHPGFPVNDQQPEVFAALFALSYEAQGIEGARVTAADQAGNRTTAPFTPTFKAVQFKQDRITLDDRFLETKIPEFQNYYKEMQGTLLEQYLYINNQVRDSNNQTISDLCGKPQGQRLWRTHLSRMPGSPRAGFADHRTYYYNGEAIDKQVHLGIDIASTQQAEVRAAAAGTVVHADYLGIYGNMVLLDHGQGLFTLYSHLSQIDVAVGQSVEHEARLGATGTSGMAGGDHLHFSVLINGIFVTPVEWWDPHWVQVNIDEPLQETLFH
ncbi:M23 family metallopeptidase [Desulfofustis limnaeus]|jgi:murein DD-endopeptidase MepM/ murein hydrolase activator NlpD|uniref:Peptidase M24 n=1 Tax=Desulfofustis limnaeus TaxID=2740163 RepID=A0ABN6M728_9BACT|nr:M23 family metallopeptidase [Desulfofustis limnaeus]MDX9897211.1 M23 family metallopeptidase [Desulfofustis sp.]BDD87134.1 peptidase M24 [Desulfofustis limnaeus]